LSDTLKELQERKHKDILEAGIKVFSDKGVMAATFIQIAKEAGVSSRTLYKHFDNKEALFAEIVELTFSEANLEKLAYDPKRPIREQLLAVTTQYIDHITTPDMIQLYRMTMGELMRDHDLAQKALTQITAQDHTVQVFIAEAMTKGGLKQDDPAIAARMLISMVKGLLHSRLMYFGTPLPLPKSKPELIGACIDMFLGYFQPEQSD
jgi:TetR/AcrR family transcriptional regulator of autoinduction and epiphytic fitness